MASHLQAGGSLFSWQDERAERSRTTETCLLQKRHDPEERAAGEQVRARRSSTLHSMRAEDQPRSRAASGEALASCVTGRALGVIGRRIDRIAMDLTRIDEGEEQPILRERPGRARWIVEQYDSKRQQLGL